MPCACPCMQAFCAGGDVKQVVLDARAGKPSSALQFFKLEYEVDHLIGRLRIPHVALIDGIVMGGGAGVSMHGHFKVATERCGLLLCKRGWRLGPGGMKTEWAKAVEWRLERGV